MAGVLIVEDEERLRRVVARGLQLHGFQVVEAASVAEALVRYADAAPDVVVLDINLPDGSAWDILRGIPADLQPRVRAIVISASPLNRAEARAFSPLVFLAKPFGMQALVHAVTDASAACAPGSAPA